LLGLSVLFGVMLPTRLLKAGPLALLRLALPAAAVMLSFDAPAELRVAPFGNAPRLAVTPALAVTGLAYLFYVCFYLPRYAPALVGAAAAVVLAAALGPSPAQVAAAGRQWAQWSFGLVARAVPRTTTGWGVTGVAAAFAFLGIGAAVSLRKPPEGETQG
jgi:hypothetical protein